MAKHKTEKINLRYLKDITISENYITVIESPLGTGKTTAIIDEIKKTNPETILFVMFRRSLTNNLLGKLDNMDFSNYLNITGKITHNRVLIQVESLHRLNKFDYDLVVIDEITSVLTQFGSPFHRDRLDDNRENFQKLLGCKKVVLMDGFIDDRAIDFIVKSINKPIHFIQNTVKIDDRKYERIKQSEVIPFIKNGVKNNMKVVVPCATKKFGVKIRDELKKSKISVLFFSGDVDDSDNPELIKNIDDVVTAFSVLIFTPTLQAGVDISVKYFDFMIAYGSPWSCCARDFVQMMWRVRHLKTRSVFYAIQHGKPPELASFDSDSVWEHLSHQVITEQNASYSNFPSELKKAIHHK